jgi:phosphoribosylformylglycinamidine (FGAM) synthase-like enzyme
VGCVGLVPDVRDVPGRWREGDAVLLASVPAGRLDLSAEAALVAFLWKVAPLLSLAHDVGGAGLEAAVEEAAQWSGRRASVDLPDGPIGSAAILACAPGDVSALGSRGLTTIGEVL